MAKVVKKPAVKPAKKTVPVKKTTAKKTTKCTCKPVCKCEPKCKCAKPQKVSIKTVKLNQTPVKKSFWTKVKEFFGF